MRRLILFIPLIVVGAMLYLFLGALDKDPTELDSARINQPVPAFSLPVLEDGSLQNQSLFQQGKPLLLNVWATWCPSCSYEHPYLVQLARDEGVTIIGLNYKDDRAAALKWLEEKGNPYTLNLSDSEGRLGLDLGVYGAPETYVIDAQGIIRYRHVGVVDEKVWNETLKPLLQSADKARANMENSSS